MSQVSIIVCLMPLDVMDRIKDEQDADLVYEEFHELGNGKCYGTLIFEKYFMRVSNRAALVVLINNLSGRTIVTSVATGSSQGMFFNFDWGAADAFAGSIKECLSNYIIEEVN